MVVTLPADGSVVGTTAASPGPTDEVGGAVARKGRARRFREARELKQGFDDGLFSEGERSLADVTDDDESGWDDDELDDDDDWDEEDPLLIDEGGRQAS
jgi:hypothetical protein